MAHGEAQAWWADVQHLRDDYERTAEARRRAELVGRRDERAGRRSPSSRGDGIAASPTRRTIEIRGRTVPAAPVASTRARERGDRRPQRPAAQRLAGRPDRIAMWALLMGVVLILVAVTTADAATIAAVAGR